LNSQVPKKLDTKSFALAYAIRGELIVKVTIHQFLHNLVIMWAVGHIGYAQDIEYSNLAWHGEF